MNKYFKSFGLYIVIFGIILGVLAFTGQDLIKHEQTAAAYTYSDLLTELEAEDPLRLYLEEIAGIPAAGDPVLLAAGKIRRRTGAVPVPPLYPGESR